MTAGLKRFARTPGRGIGILLAVLAVWAMAAAPARALDCVAEAGGIIDGFVNYPIPPAQIQIDGNCRIQNYPASNPLTSNISWFGNNPTSWLLIFDNVVHTGNMSCNLPSQSNKIWFVNSSSSSVQEHCLDLLIPVEKIDKKNPPGPPFVTVGVPFTWTMTIPVLYDPATGTVIDNQGSVNDLHSITVWDDLNATGVDLSYVSHTVRWLDDGTDVPHSFTNVGGFLTFDGIPIVDAGRQFVISLNVVLRDTPTNAPGTTFFNTARWDFGRLIDGTFFEPLPGENGVTPPLTISGPMLVVDKSGPATMNLGEWGDFTVDARNTGFTDAWDVSFRDQFPDGATGGMCDQTPEIVSARVFAADGVTPVAGKGPLLPGVDYQPVWTGAPTCRLDLTMLTAAARIGAGERLIVRYRTRLDADTDNGIALTNVAGAVQWWNGDASNPDRVVFDRTITNGTVGIQDHEDAHTVTTALTGFFFEKTVADLTSGADPARSAAPGDRLRYTLRFRATDQPLNNFRIFDELDRMNAPPAFAAGTLALVTVPPGANTSGTSATGGPAGTGVLDVRNLNVLAGGEIVVQFDITLAGLLPNGKVVANQSASFRSDNSPIAPSDDPTVNGMADPEVVGDEDPTRLVILANPLFRIQKTSTDLTGDPNVLLAGETLRYTITVKNIGNGDATGVVLRDSIPVNTTYVPGSTRLNGTPLADLAGTSPLVGGMAIQPPSATPGSMSADPSSNTANVATIVFDVVVDPAVVDGTVISNQGFVSAVAQSIIDRPSDDPDTPIADDPTLDIVGNLPLLYAEKSVVLFGDLGSPGIVDPGDVLRYTIRVQNSAAIPATGVVLTDSVPANTTYVADSTRLNGLPVGQPDSGSSPLASGIDISSTDRTPPLPGAGAGTISPNRAAVLQFDLRVNTGTPAGTLISNQAVVESVELPDLLTDGDGNPATGPEPTVVVVGAGQELSITKQVAVVGGGPALPGSTLEYVVQVANFGAVPAQNVVLTDDLDASGPGRLAYVNGSATMNGATAGVSFAGSTLTGDYAGAYGALQPGETIVLRFRATLAPTLVDGTVVTNTGVVAWGNPTRTASASVSIVVGGIPGVAALGGAAWHDADFDDARDAGERALSGWTVRLYRDGALVHSTTTAADGTYRILGVEPNFGTPVVYELQFLAPGAGPTTALLGRAASPFTNDLQRIENIVVASGATVQGLDLPIDPNGVVYNSMARTPIAGATLTLRDAASGSLLPTICFDDPAQQGQVTLSDGYYKFDVNFADSAACPSDGTYVIRVAPPPGTSYVAGASQIIIPGSDAATAAFSVPDCPTTPEDAIPATATYCEAQGSEFAPAATIPPNGLGTIHYLHLRLRDGPTEGTSQIFNNHIPLDPQLAGTVAITKTTPVLYVTRGQIVPYTITVTNVSGMLLTDMSIVDRYPAGFTYVAGSALVDGQPLEPVVAGRELRWENLTLTGTQVRTVKLLLAVGAGVSEGEYTNRAQAVNLVNGELMSGEAAATVRLVPDPTFDCTDVLGKVFDDVDRDGVQDETEVGLPGVRLVTARGLQATTDAHGRYHITCAITPHESRGSNFVIKLDDRTLPSGFRPSTEPVRVQRATRGKALTIDFGASIFRVVAIDLSDAVFEPGTTDIRIQWRPRLDLLLAELRKGPAVLRLSYVADTEEASLVQKRLDTVRQHLTDAWRASEGGYPLTIEPEIFWRLGAPPPQRDRRAPEGR